MDFDYVYAPVIKGKVNDIKAVSFISIDFLDRVKPIFDYPHSLTLTSRNRYLPGSQRI